MTMTSWIPPKSRWNLSNIIHIIDINIIYIIYSTIEETYLQDFRVIRFIITRKNKAIFSDSL